MIRLYDLSPVGLFWKIIAMLVERPIAGLNARVTNMYM